MATIKLPGRSILDMDNRKIEGLPAGNATGDASNINQVASTNVWQESLRNHYVAGQTVFDFEAVLQGNVTVERDAIGGGAVGYTLDPLPMAQGDLTDAEYEDLFDVVPSGSDSLEIDSIDDETGLLTFVDPPTQSFTITYPPDNFGATLGFSSRQYSRRATPNPDPLPVGGLERPIDGTYNQEDFGLNASAYWIRLPINGRVWNANQHFIVGDVVSYIDTNGVDRHVYCEFPHTSTAETNPILAGNIVHEAHTAPVAGSPWRPLGSSIDISTGESAAARLILVEDDGDAAVVFAVTQLAIPAGQEQQWTITVTEDRLTPIELPEGQVPVANDLVSFRIGETQPTQEFRVSAVDDGLTIIRFAGTIPAEVQALFDTGDPVNILDAGARQDFGQIDRMVFDPTDFTVNTEAQNIGHAHVAANPQEIISRQVLRNNVPQTLEQWIAAGNAANTFVSDSRYTLNFITLAKNEAIQTTPFNEVEFATEQGGDYHVDLLEFDVQSGRIILKTDNVQTAIDGRLEVVTSLPGTAVDTTLNTENAVNNQAVYLAVAYTDNEAAPPVFYGQGTYSYSTDTNSWTQTGGGGSGGFANGSVVNLGATSTIGGVQVASTADVLQDGNSNGEIPIWDNDNSTWLRYHLLINGVNGTENFILDNVQDNPILRATTQGWQEANLLEKGAKLPTTDNFAGRSFYLTTLDGTNQPGTYTFETGGTNDWVATGPELLPATVATLGGMRPGAGLTIDTNGIVAANPVVQNDQITVPNLAGVIPVITSSTELNQSTMSDDGVGVTMSGGLDVTGASALNGGLTTTSMFAATLNGAPINALEKIGYFLGRPGTIEGTDFNVTYTINGVTGRFTAYTTVQGGVEYVRFFYSGLAIDNNTGDYIAGAGVWANYEIADPQTQADFGAINLIG